MNEIQYNLFIIRHAQTLGGQYYNSDKERALKPAGIAEAIQLDKYLSNSDYAIDLIISVDAECAWATALLLANEINYPIHKIQFVEKTYSGALPDLLKVIHETPDSVNTL